MRSLITWLDTAAGWFVVGIGYGAAWLIDRLCGLAFELLEQTDEEKSRHS